MASVHVLALSHIAGLVMGLALLTFALRGLVRGTGVRVRSEYAPRRRHPVRSLVRFLACSLRRTARLAAGLGLALVSPIGILCANRRYPLVAPVLAPCEARLAALGHRTGNARCFPLLVCTLWLVRCTGCHRRSVFREVPAANGRGVDLKALGTGAWRTHPCPAEYLTARPAQAASAPARPIRVRRPRRRPVPAGHPATPASSPPSPSGVTDRTA